MPTAAFTTLGCKVNQYETQKILEDFEQAGFDIVPFNDKADVYVINSCSVTSQAESKSRYTIRKASRTNPESRVVVTGCAAQMGINKSEPIEGADVIVPNPEKLKTLDYFLNSYPEYKTLQPLNPKNKLTSPAGGRTRATIKVQDGCNVMCSYCSIPATRPGMVSRPWQEVLEEAQMLSEMGYHEAILTGVLIGAYGPDSGSEGKTFEELVTILSEQSGLARLRISSIEMHQVTDEIIHLVKNGNVVPHFHIPLQSGDTQVLKDMNRRYGQKEYLDLCHKLYSELDDLTITTDIMVGFPTEGEDEFQSSVKVCEEVQYLKAHIFRFSPRYGTVADQWGDPVSPEIKQTRSKILHEITSQTATKQMDRFLGRTLRVLVERKSKQDGLLEGTTDNWLTVKFAGSSEMVRTLQHVRLDEVKSGIVFGELASAPQAKELSLVSK